MIRKHKYLILLFSLIIILFGYAISQNHETTFYIGIANPSDDIDMLVQIDDHIILRDTLEYSPYNYTTVKENLKGGFHTLVVKSAEGDIIKKRSFLLLLNQNVIIEYFPKTSSQKPDLRIDNQISPFHYE